MAFSSSLQASLALSSCTSDAFGTRAVSLTLPRLALPKPVQRLRPLVSSGPIADSPESECSRDVPRRRLLAGIPAVAAGALLASGISPLPALATPSFTAPPPGFRLYVDRFDGYSFYIPETWVQVRGSGQDCFFRNPSILDENISVQVSSPTSSRFMDITDLGSPEEAGQQLLKQFLTEFMSTRLGVKRDPNLLRSDVRTTMDGEDYYEIEVNVKSYANTNQMAILPEDRETILEWDRHYLTVLGVANNRLYQLRAQVPEKLLNKEIPELQQILNSFQAFSVLSV